MDSGYHHNTLLLYPHQKGAYTSASVQILRAHLWLISLDNRLLRALVEFSDDFVGVLVAVSSNNSSEQHGGRIRYAGFIRYALSAAR
jgi:hypothetical protein